VNIIVVKRRQVGLLEIGSSHKEAGKMAGLAVPALCPGTSAHAVPSSTTEGGGGITANFLWSVENSRSFLKLALTEVTLLARIDLCEAV